MFHIGQRVVLVGWNEPVVRSWRSWNPAARYPNVGDVYTIREIKPWEGSAVLLLEEINNSHLNILPEPGFRQDFFRPVAEPKIKNSTIAREGIDA